MMILSLLGTILIGGCSAAPQSPVYSMKTPGREDFDALIFLGDTQRTSVWEFWREQNDEERSAVLEKIALDNPAFVIHLGDVVFQGSSDKHWRRFDENAFRLREAGIPLLPVPGNHDYYGNKKQALKNFFSRFPVPEKKTWSSLSFKDVGIILLDSNVKHLGKKDRDLQYEWYIQTLREFQDDPHIAIILVACHHAPYTNSKTVTDNKYVQEAFVKPFNETPKAKAFFSGHCHSYEHFMMGDRHFLVSGGGGGPRHTLKTGKKARHRDMFQAGTKRPFHYCRVSPVPAGLCVDMISYDKDRNAWTLGERFIIPKI